MLSFVDFQKTPELISEVDRARVSEFQLVEQSDIIIARDLFVEIDHDEVVFVLLACPRAVLF